MRPAVSPDTFPISDPTTDAGKQAAKLHSAWAAQYARVDQVDDDHRAAEADLTAAESAMQDTLSRCELGDASAADVRAAEDTLADAKAAANAPWQERAIAAGQAAEQRRADYEAFVDDNLDDLVTELEADAKAAVDAIIKGAEAFLAGFDEYQRCRDQSVAAIRPAQLIDGQAVPVLGANARDAVTVIEALLGDPQGSLPVPVPAASVLRWRRSQLVDAPESSAAAEAGDDGQR